MRELGHEVFPLVMGGTEKTEVDVYHQEITGKRGLRYKIFKMLPLIVRNTLKDVLLLKHDLMAAKSLKLALNSFKPDLVYERNEYLQNGGLKVVKRAGNLHYLEINSPCVSEMRNFEGPSLLHFLGKKKEQYKVRNTDRIFAVSTALKDFIGEEYGSTAPIEIIPNCINPNRMPLDLSVAKELREKWNPEDSLVIGFVGSIFPYHGVEKLIRAYAKSLDLSTVKTFLMIVGDGALRLELEKLANEILPFGSFGFTGKIPHPLVMDYISMFDIAVMPDSNWYGSPIKIFEYGLLGKLQIVPNKGPLRDVMIENEDGIYSDATIEGLAKALVKGMEEFKDLTWMGENFKSKILENYTWEKQTAKTLSFVKT